MKTVKWILLGLWLLHFAIKIMEVIAGDRNTDTGTRLVVITCALLIVIHREYED